MKDDEILKKIRQALTAPPPQPIEGTRWFLHGFCSDAESLESIRCHVAGMIEINPRPIIEGLSSIERLLADPRIERGQLLLLVEYDAGWVLNDKSDEGARAWLQMLASMLHEELAHAELFGSSS